jgi:hypothetical protein
VVPASAVSLTAVFQRLYSFYEMVVIDKPLHLILIIEQIAGRGIRRNEIWILLTFNVH